MKQSENLLFPSKKSSRTKTKMIFTSKFSLREKMVYSRKNYVIKHLKLPGAARTASLRESEKLYVLNS